MEKDTVSYFGIVHQDKGSSLGVSFPDFPGCVSAGDSVKELTRNAREALQFHIKGMVKDGLPIPDPSADPPDRGADLVLFHVTVEIPRLSLKR